MADNSNHLVVEALLRAGRDPSDHESAPVRDKGLGRLAENADPSQMTQVVALALDRSSEALASIRRELEKSQQQLEIVRAALLTLAAKKSPADERVDPHGLTEKLRAKLQHWRQSGLLGDCPLPELFRHLRQSQATLSIGQFHDHLRHLHQHQEIYLHPWTGPLYQLPEPALALLIGHEIAYYANLRN